MSSRRSLFFSACWFYWEKLKPQSIAVEMSRLNVTEHRFSSSPAPNSPLLQSAVCLLGRGCDPTLKSFMTMTWAFPVTALSHPRAHTEASFYFILEFTEVSGWAWCAQTQSCTNTSTKSINRMALCFCFLLFPLKLNNSLPIGLIA